MKKLIVFIGLLLSVLAVQSQDKTVTLQPGLDGVYTTFWGASTDAITNTGSATYVFALNTPYTLDAYVQVVVTKVTGYAKVKILLSESQDNVTYYAITNMAADTCKTGLTCSKFFKSAVLTAKVTGRYLKVTATGIDSTQHDHLSGYVRFVRKYDNF